MKKINCILLVDDNPVDNAFHKIIITKADICNNVREVANGEQALSYIKKAGEQELHTSQQDLQADFPKPDIILLDINMPRMNGFEFLENYSKLDANLKAKVLIVMLATSLTPSEELKITSNKEVTGFQNKPMNVKTLHEIVEKYF